MADDDLPLLPENAPSPGRYRHYKGNEYEVEGHALHSETLEWLVVYRSLRSPDTLWVRPLAMFVETVALPEGTRLRFEPLG